MSEEDKKESSEVRHWLNEISAAKRREKEFRREGERINDIYEGGKKNAQGEATRAPFNILFSNTETMLPSIYSQVPRPVVDRRFKDDDKNGKAAAIASQRMLEFALDTNIEGYETFNEAMQLAVLAGLLPGRGVTAIKYDAEVLDVEEDASDEAEEVGSESNSTPYVRSELVCTESIEWDRVWFGYAKKWSKVPWVAYEKHFDKDECLKLFDEAKVEQIKFSTGEDRDASEDEIGRDEDEQDIGERKTALIYQIWDKDSRTIVYVSPQYDEDVLLEEDDPLKLTGFFNCPKPIQFVQKLSDTIPTPMYSLYEQQATELNNLSRRIIHIISAIKAKGIYDGALGSDIQNILQASENELTPAETMSALGAEKGLDKAIWFWPVEKLIVVLQQLYQAREACKQVIYEITGIADIMRGSSNASETLGAQQIKQQWGTLRLNRLQKEVQRYARDLLRMMLEVAAQKFSVDTWAKMTGLPFVKREEQQAAKQMMQLMQQQYQMAAQQAASVGQPPPPQPPPDPAAQYAIDAPVWEDVIAVLQDDIQRSYRIDIETNTTVEADATEDKKNIAEVMNALAQFLNGVAPLVTAGVMPFEAAQGMMMAIIRRFRFGPEIEDYIKQMKAPPPPDDGGKADQAKLQADQAKLQSDTQAAQDKLKADLEGNLAKIQQAKDSADRDLEKQAMKLEFEKMKFEFEKEMAASEHEHAVEIERIRLEAQQHAGDTEMKATLAGAKQAMQSMLDKHAARIDLQKETIKGDSAQKVAVIQATAAERAAAARPAPQGAA